MSAPRRGFVAAGREMLQTVFADGLQHHEARLSRTLLGLLGQTLVHHRSHAVEDVQSKVLPGVADRFHGFQSASADEERKAAGTVSARSGVSRP